MEDINQYAPKILEAGLHPEMWQPLLNEIAEDYSFDRICLLQETSEHLLQNRLGFHWSNVPDIPQLKATAMSIEPNAWIPAHSAFAAKAMSLRVGDHFDRREFYPDRQLEKFFGQKGQFSSEGMFHLATVMMGETKDWMSGIWVGRTRSGNEVHESSLVQLGQLAPFFGHAMKLHAELSDSKFLNSGLSLIFERSNQGILFVDKNLKIYWKNEAAQKFESEFSGVSFIYDKLSFSDRYVSNALMSAVAELAIDVASLPDIFAQCRVSRKVVKISAFRALGGAGITYPTRAEFIIKISSTESETRNSNTPIFSNFGLTIRESEFAAAYLENDDVAVILEKMGISNNTLKTYRKSVFDKLGVSSRFELLMLFGRI